MDSHAFPLFIITDIAENWMSIAANRTDFRNFQNEFVYTISAKILKGTLKMYVCRLI
jgi:uncharacterized protein involved in type VI secretion and phage assembly